MAKRIKSIDPRWFAVVINIALALFLIGMPFYRGDSDAGFRSAITFLQGMLVMVLIGNIWLARQS